MKTLLFGVFAAVVAGSVLTPARAAGAAHSVWDGVYSGTQASRGQQSYLDYCSRCHGRESTLWKTKFWPVWREDSLESFYDYVRDNMPNNDPGGLQDATYLDIVAYILSRNGLPAGSSELTPAEAADVTIIAKDGPGELPDSTLVSVGGCLVHAPDGSWSLAHAGKPVRMSDGVTVAPQIATVGAGSFTLKYVMQSLEPWTGHTIVATGLLIGDGGKDGINVMTTVSLSDHCAAP